MIQPGPEHNEFLNIFKNTKDRVYHLFLKHTGDEHVTQDLIQETYLRMWVRRDDIISEGAENYLFTIAYHLLADWHRSKIRSRLNFMETLPDMEGTATPETVYVYKATQKKVAATLATLSTRQKAAFQLIKEEEKSYKQAAEELGTPVSTLEKQIAASLKLLRKALHLFF